MKTTIFALATAILAILLGSQVRAQSFVNDNDGLLDVGEAPGFPADPMAATGTLRLTERGIQDLDGTSLLTNLQRLFLYDNQITSIESGDFQGLTNLQDLNLGRNQIASIESGAFDGLHNLQKLYLYNNELTSIESGDFKGLTNLQYLNLGGNPIASIESGDFDGLASLQTLYLYGNDITSIESGDFDGLTNLRILGLYGTQITSIESGAFNGLTNLQSLDLSFNPITSIESGAFDGLLNLQRLDLSRNPITSIEGISLLLGLELLEYLAVDPSLVGLYANELSAWDSMPGKTLRVQGGVPEPTAFCLAMGILSGLFLRLRTMSSAASRLPG